MSHKHRCGWRPRKTKAGFLGPVACSRNTDSGKGCGFVWTHSDVLSADRTKAHTCPNCGKEEWWKYRGKVKPGHGIVNRNKGEKK